MKLKSAPFAAVISLCLATFQLQAANIVGSVVKAAISPSGNVAKKATDILINLDTSLDPAIQGRTLLAGHTIKVRLPDSFVDKGKLPLQDLFSSPSCVPGNLQCTTAALLQGWPQHPILPRVPPTAEIATTQYSLSFEEPNTLVITANVDIIPGVAAPGPGIKQIHLIFNGFKNPRRPSYYPIEVEAETGPNGELETGQGFVHIVRKTQESINITSAFNPGTPNTIFQKTTPGALTPLPYDFLLWNRRGRPFKRVRVKMINDHYALLKKGRRVVGHIQIAAPPGATSHEIFTEESSSVINSPLSGIPTARLTTFFRAGDVPGNYVVTLSLNDCDPVQMFVEVEPLP